MYTEKELENMARKYNFQISFGINIIYIHTNIAYWRLIHNGEKVIQLLHENYRPRGKNSKLSKEHKGFHIQAINDYSYDSVFEYISHHDTNFFKNEPLTADKMFTRALTRKIHLA